MPPVAPAAGRVICVGVDSSADSRAAAVWAAAMAVQSASVLRLVSVYGDAGLTRERTRQDALDDIAEVIALMPQSLAETCVALGEPADRLLDAARGADILVLGRHSTRGMIHSALGSVGDTCARLADCPVVVVVPHLLR